ncbi:hypothetical protein MRX96_026436 [Rhipicephalus microplus]
MTSIFVRGRSSAHVHGSCCCPRNSALRKRRQELRLHGTPPVRSEENTDPKQRTLLHEAAAATAQQDRARGRREPSLEVSAHVTPSSQSARWR